MTRPPHCSISDIHICHIPGKHRESCSLAHHTRAKVRNNKPEIGTRMIGVMGEHTATHCGWVQLLLGMLGELHGVKAHDGQIMCQRYSLWPFLAKREMSETRRRSDLGPQGGIPSSPMHADCATREA